MPTGLIANDGALAVHTVLLFPGPVAKGMEAARALRPRLLGDVRAFFAYVKGPGSAWHLLGGTGGGPCLPCDWMGEVHMEEVSFPYLVS